MLPGQTQGSAGGNGLNVPAREPSSIALPLPEDRGAAALQEALRRLKTTASVMEIVAHPDDEDGGLLTYLSRGLGVRTILFTLTRGEGGQNAMSADTYDALGVMRTNELLKADEYYGVKQLWGTEADFGFSKTQEEAFARWGHERVLYDAVLAVRRERPQVIIATFAGGVSDGHGQHQVSGEIAQEVFKAAGDPKVFPEQLKQGLQPWQPLAVYSMTPFAPITDKGMFDYATGKWAPARFHNYVTGEWTTGALSTDATMPVGTRDAVLGRSYAQIARQGWGEQKSQNGGANPTLSGPATASYHLWAVDAAAKGPGSGEDHDLFHNRKVNVDTSVAGLAHLAGGAAPSWLTDGLKQIDADLTQFEAGCSGREAVENAHRLTPVYRQILQLHERMKKSDLSDLSEPAKAGLDLEFDAKIAELQEAFKALLGLEVTAFRTNETRAEGNVFRGSTADETPGSVAPGEEFRVRIHTAQATTASRVDRVWLRSRSGDDWKAETLTPTIEPGAAAGDVIYKVTAAEDAEATKPYFTRPTIEQPYYDISNEKWRERSFAPYPLDAWAEFDFDGIPIQIGTVVQTLQRVTGPGGMYEPLVVTPAIGVRMDPEARILPLDGSPLPVKVTVHTQRAAEGTVSLKLPEGWRSEPTEAHFNQKGAGDTGPIEFSVTPSAVKTGAYDIGAVVQAGGRTYASGWRGVGWLGLRPYNVYRSAELKTRKVDVKMMPGLRIGYVMGPGDLVPQALEEMGAQVHLMTAEDITTGDLSGWSAIVIGIRAYSTRPELAGAEARLEAYVRAGGTMVVQYQSANFPAPLPLTMGGRTPERVVDEQAPVKILEPGNALLQKPNIITANDFGGWVEERGHSFLESWDPGYTALTVTADAGQDPQKGGLLVAHPGKGTYIYVAYALYRQLPELVPGAYRILANLVSAGAAQR